MYQLTMTSPIGRLTLLSDGDRLTRILFPGEGSTEADGAEAGPDLPVLTAARDQLAEYFDGTRRSFDLPLEPGGTEFQRSVWRLLLGIPFGKTTTYGKLAGKLGNPKANRAVGAANGRNPLPIVVPCHRVIGSDGKLTGFAGGLPVKQWLLEHEGAR